LHLITKLKFTVPGTRLKLGYNYDSVSPLRLNGCANGGQAVILYQQRGILTTIALKHKDLNSICNFNEGIDGR